MRQLPGLQGRRRGRTGAALVVVLVFAILALMLVSTMMTMTELSVRAEGEQQRHRALQALLKLGIADALQEINQFRELGGAYVDPEGNGPGAITGTGDAGVELRGPGGRLLGRYRTLVDRVTYAPKTVLTVVVTSTTFTDRNALLLGAELELLNESAASPTDASPLSIVGPVNLDDSDISIESGNDFDIVAPAADTPAVNITDAAYHADFVTNVVPVLDQVYGSSLTDPGAGASGAATVANDPPGFISESTMLAIRDGAEDLVADHLATAATISGAGVYVNPTGFYKMSSVTLEANQVIKGSGTLFVTDGFTAKQHATFDWKGTIIVLSASNARLSFEMGATVRIGGDTDPAANNPVDPSTLVVLGVDQDAKLQIRKDADVQVNGSFLMLAYSTDTDDTDAKIKFKKDFDATFNGIFAVFAEDMIELDIDKESSTRVNGSLALVTRGLDWDEDDEGGEVDIKIKKDGSSSLVFDQAAFLAARAELMDYFAPYLPGGLEAAKVTSYWEPAGATLRDRQEQLMAVVVDDDDWGVAE